MSELSCTCVSVEACGGVCCVCDEMDVHVFNLVEYLNYLPVQ